MASVLLRILRPSPVDIAHPNHVSRPLRNLPPTLFLLAILLSGCQSPRPQLGSSFFPIGIYDAPLTNLALLRDVGFNTVTGPQSIPFLDEASRHRLHVLASPPDPATLTNAAALQNLRRLDTHPALWSWYLFDEPDLHRVSPTNIWQRNRALVRHAKKPTTLVLMSGSSTARYRFHSDFIGLDFYPVPWAPISQLGKELKLARFALGQQPCFAILQAFDWTAFPDLLDTEQPLRPPTYDELRCMVYIALAQQAKGLFFYTLAAGQWRLLEHPLWSAVKNIVREINDYLPLFTARHLWWSPETEYLDGADSAYNEVRDAKICLVLLQVTKGNSSVQPGIYAIAINTTADRVPFTLELPHHAPSVPMLGPANTRSTLPLRDQSLTREFAPFEVLCLGPLR